jgi:adenosylhomocysteinase
MKEFIEKNEKTLQKAAFQAEKKRKTPEVPAGAQGLNGLSSPEKYEETANRFYQEVVEALEIPVGQEIVFVATIQVTKTLSSLLKFLQQIGRLGLLIPKTTQKDKSIWNSLLLNPNSPYQQRMVHHFLNELEYPVANPDCSYRDLIQQKAADGKPLIVHILKQVIQTPQEKIIFLDNGGYFPPVLDAIKAEFPGNHCVLVEETANGEAFCEQLIATGTCPYPLITIARTEIKQMENSAVGKGIADAAISILDRKHGPFKLEKNLQQILVLGYGGVGSQLVEHLSRLGYNPWVFDSNPNKLALAAARGYKIPSAEDEKDSRSNAISKADVIFCMTGNHCLTRDDIPLLRPDVLIVPSTSFDREFAEEFNQMLQINQNRFKKPNGRKESITKIKIPFSDPAKAIYIVGGGNGANFSAGANNGSPIFDGLAFWVAAGVKEIIDRRIQPEQYNALHLPPGELEKMINTIWLKHFYGVTFTSNKKQRVGLIDRALERQKAAELLLEKVCKLNERKAVTQQESEKIKLIKQVGIYSEYLSSAKTNLSSDTVKLATQFIYQLTLEYPDDPKLTSFRQKVAEVYPEVLKLKPLVFSSESKKIEQYLEMATIFLSLDGLPFVRYLCGQCESFPPTSNHLCELALIRIQLSLKFGETFETAEQLDLLIKLGDEEKICQAIEFVERYQLLEEVVKFMIEKGKLTPEECGRLSSCVERFNQLNIQFS